MTRKWTIDSLVVQLEDKEKKGKEAEPEDECNLIVEVGKVVVAIIAMIGLSFVIYESVTNPNKVLTIGEVGLFVLIIGAMLRVELVKGIFMPK